ncbi:MAG: hypothetical protein ABUS79_26725 [Pseudomonadota bacterium]
MATTTFGETNFVIQAAETELTWIVSWGLQRDEWFNFQVAPDFSDGAIENLNLQSTVEITRQWQTVEPTYPWEVRAWIVVKNASPAGSEVVLGFTGLRSHG